MKVSGDRRRNGLMAVILLIPSMCFGTELANRQLLVTWLSDPSGLSIDIPLAAVLAESMPEDIVRDILSFPDPAYVHLSGRCVTLAAPASDSTSEPQSIQLCMFGSLAHSYMAGVVNDDGSYEIVSDTLVHAYHQPQFAGAPMEPDEGCIELIAVYGVPAPGRWGMTRYALVEWCRREFRVVVEVSGVDLGTADVDHDGQVELRVTDVDYLADPDTVFFRYYTRDPVTRLFRETPSDTTLPTSKTVKK